MVFYISDNMADVFSFQGDTALNVPASKVLLKINLVATFGQNGIGFLMLRIHKRPLLALSTSGRKKLINDKGIKNSV